MPQQTAPAETDDRPSLVAVLCRRTPFTLRLPGCTVAGVLAAATTASPPRRFRLKTEDGLVKLRYYGSGFYNMTWSVKAEVQPAADGVLLTGHLRYLLDRISVGLLVAFTMILLGIAAWLGISSGLTSDFKGCLGAAVVIGLVTAFNLVWVPGMTAKRTERASQILRDALS